MLTVLDEFTHQALCVELQDKMKSDDVLVTKHRLLMKHGKPNLFVLTMAAISLLNIFRTGLEKLG